MRWRRQVAHARAAGQPEPAPPDVAPISLNLDLTTACNYRCDHCIDWDILNTKHRHDEGELRESIRSLRERGLRSLILIGGGEPTLFPGFEGFVRFAKGLGLQIAVVSNGGQGDKLLAIADALGPGDWLRLSLDAGSDERFRAMHRPVSRSLTLDEICAWVPRIKARNPDLRIGYSYIIVWRGASRDGVALHENIDEIVLATRRARRFGFDFIALKPVLERAPDGAEVMDPAAAQEELSQVVARIRGEIDQARALARRRLQRPRQHESARARVGQLERAHAAAANLPRAGAAPGADADRPLQLPGSPRRRARADRGSRRLRRR